jgi:hypothetical protein
MGKRKRTKGQSMPFYFGQAINHLIIILKKTSMFDLTLIQLKVLLRTPMFSGVRVTRSLVLCVCFVDH